MLDAGPGHAATRPRRLFPTAPSPRHLPDGLVSGQQPLPPTEHAGRQVLSRRRPAAGRDARQEVDLRPHVVEVVGQKAKANLFEVPGGYALPVTFGGQQSAAMIILRGLPRLARQKSFRVEMIHPGEEQWQHLSMPSGYRPNPRRKRCRRRRLARGGSTCRSCAAARWSSSPMLGSNPKVTWFDSVAEVKMGTTIAGGEIRYTLDGAEPSAGVPRRRLRPSVSVGQDGHGPRRGLRRRSARRQGDDGRVRPAHSTIHWTSFAGWTYSGAASSAPRRRAWLAAEQAIPGPVRDAARRRGWPCGP